MTLRQFAGLQLSPPAFGPAGGEREPLARRRPPSWGGRPSAEADADGDGLVHRAIGNQALAAAYIKQAGVPAGWHVAACAVNPAPGRRPGPCDCGARRAQDVWWT